MANHFGVVDTPNSPSEIHKFSRDMGIPPVTINMVLEPNLPCIATVPDAVAHSRAARALWGAAAKPVSQERCGGRGCPPALFPASVSLVAVLNEYFGHCWKPLVLARHVGLTCDWVFDSGNVTLAASRIGQDTRKRCMAAACGADR